MFFRRESTRTLTVHSDREEIQKVQDFITKCLKGTGASEDAILQLELIVEEIFINIASYAYAPPGSGDVDITCKLEKDMMKVTLTFVDEGLEFDPLERGDPDVTQPVKDRKVGGLGIYLVKKTVDGIAYRRENGRNVLTIEKHLS